MDPKGEETMTKSRTLRKAGAVVLSLAMAFSVASVAPDASAAAKQKTAATKATPTKTSLSLTAGKTSAAVYVKIVY